MCRPMDGHLCAAGAAARVGGGEPRVPGRRDHSPLRSSRQVRAPQLPSLRPRRRDPLLLCAGRQRKSDRQEEGDDADCSYPAHVVLSRHGQSGSGSKPWVIDLTHYLTCSKLLLSLCNPHKSWLEEQDGNRSTG
jgi:hypothetical protein